MLKTVLDTLKEMDSIDLEHLKGTAHAELVKDTLMAAQACDAVMQNLPAQVQTLQECYDAEVQASLLENEYQKLTDEAYELSAERAKAQTALKAGFRAEMGMSNPQKVEAAMTLFNLMHKYDLHTGMNIDDQTALINSFIVDIETNYSSQLALSSMGELYTNLKALNDAVCDKMFERDESAVGKGINRMLLARQATDKAWRDLRTGTNAFAYVQGYEGYAHFIGHMNVLIIRYKRVHLGQTTSSPEAEPGETTPGEGGEQQPGEGEQQPGEGEQQPTTPTEPTNPTKYNAVFTANGSTVATQQYEAGEVIQAPEAPSGYEWEEFPYRMPEHDITVNAVRKYVPGGGGGSGFE